MTYNQSGFDLDEKRGHNKYAYVRFSKIGWVKLRYTRPIPDRATIEEVTVRKDRTGEWFVSFGLEIDDATLPETPPVDSLDASNSVGIDLAIRNYIHTSDGTTVDWLDLEDEYDRLRREQRKLSRKDHGSSNWEKRRREVATATRRIRRKVLDFQHKLTTWLVKTSDAVFVEDLDVAGMLQGDGNARNRQNAAWRQFIQLLEYKAELYGTHVVQVDPEGTTKECARTVRGVTFKRPSVAYRDMTRLLPDGVYPVMLTPFTAEGEIDYDGLDALVDWYLDAGVAGLFAVSQSSEMFDLSDDERLALAERVVERADVPVVATGTFGGPVAEQARFVNRMAGTGVDSVVVNAAQLADADDDEATWERTLNDLLDRTDADLGFYECPRPYHRTISPAALGRAADTGRFRFLKETESRPSVVAEKVAAAEGTPLSVYVANATVLDEGLDNGARGYSGIAANVYPELLAWFCRHHDEPAATGLERFLTVADHAARNAYPTSAKAYVARTVDIGTGCRVEDRTLTPSDEHTLDALAASVAARRDEHGIPAPLADG